VVASAAGSATSAGDGEAFGLPEHERRRAADRTRGTKRLSRVAPGSRKGGMVSERLKDD